MSIVEKFDGRYLRVGEEIYRVHGRDPEKPAVIIESSQGLMLSIAASEFRDHISRGNVSDGMRPEFGSHLAHSEQADEAAFRKAVLKKLGKLQADGMTWARIMPALREHFEDHPEFALRALSFPSQRTLQHWRANTVQAGSKALFDNRCFSGNSLPRHDDIFDEIVLDLLDKAYLKSDRQTVTELTKEARELYRSRCKASGIKPGPCGRKVVEGIIASLPHSDVVKSRLGADIARKKLNQAGRFQDVRYPFDRVEVDSTLANIFVFADEDYNKVRPWITTAIDAATGFLVGMQISVDRPTAITTATVLRECMTGPDEQFFDLHGIENRIRVYGMPQVIVTDQGGENRGPVIDRLLQATGIEQQRNVPGQPQKKPYTERSQRTMKTFISGLPGTTQTSELPAKARTDKAKSEACLTLEAFITAMQVWRFDNYAKAIRRRVQAPLKRAESPSEAWQRLEREIWIPEPPSKEDLDQIFYCIKEERNLHHYGIEVGRIQYWSPDLGYLHKDKKVREVQVWINPTDIREIAVDYGEPGNMIFVPAKDPELPAISIEERDRILARNRREPTKVLTAREILAAIADGDHHKPETAKTKQAKTNSAARRNRRDKELAKGSISTRREAGGLVETSGAQIAVSASDERFPFVQKAESRTLK